MSERITLSGDQWAELLAADEVPERRRRNFLAVQGQMVKDSGITVTEEGKPDTSALDTGAMMLGWAAVNDAMIMCHLKAWSFKDEDNVDIPVDKSLTVDALADHLNAGQYDAILAKCKELSEALVLDTSAEGAGDPESPTEPLAASDS